MSFSAADAIARRSLGATPDRLKQINAAVVWLAMAFAMLLALLAVFYAFTAFPMTDDIERTSAMRVLSPWARVADDYGAIDGRWFSLLIQYLCYSGDRTWQRYFLMLIIPHLLVLLGLCCLAALVWRRPLASREAVGAGLVAYAYLWVSLPAGESLYWFPALLGYWLPPALGLITLFLLTRSTGLWSRPLILLLALILPALHEVCGGWIAGAFGVITLVRLINRRGRAWFSGLATLIALASLASEVLAPGVRIRAKSTAHMPIPDALAHGYQHYGLLLHHWPSLLAIGLLLVLATSRLPERPVWYAQAPHLIKLSLTLACIPFAILLLGAIAYSLGGGVPPRLYDGVYVLVVIGLVLLAALIGFDLGTIPTLRHLSDSRTGDGLRSLCIVAALIATLPLPRTHAAFYELGTAMRNRIVAEQRDADLRAAHKAGQSEVVLHQKLLPMLILPTGFDYNDDPTWYANQDAESYYNIRSIRVLPPQP